MTIGVGGDGAVFAVTVVEVVVVGDGAGTTEEDAVDDGADND